MSSSKVPPFDMLTGQQYPYSGFGKAQVHDSQLPNSYLQTVCQARKRTNEIFGINYATTIEDIQAIEKVIAAMWDEAWDPTQADINLFVTDFGCVVTEGLRDSLRGSLVLRSENDLSHASLWFPRNLVEVFPFHATYKRLRWREGQSLVFFAARVRELLSNPGELS